MSCLRVSVVFGTRPEAIKLAPLIRRLEAEPSVRPRVITTGQHRELLDQVVELFDLRPTLDLQVMRPDQTLGALTARLLLALERELCDHPADWVVVQGDTTTAMAAALSAYYLRVPVAHVEAGLRTDDPHNPFPEEINRRFVDELAQLHFAPTARARDNLLAHGVNSATIHVTGNTGIDALLEVARRMGSVPHSADGRRLLLVTAHRRESFGPDLLAICRALRTLVIRNADVDVVYAVHPNPNVCGPVHRELDGIPGVDVVTALPYARFVDLMRRSYLILTDSGGIQEEAPALGKPVLVLRARTERVEALDAGTARLVGTDCDRIVAATEWLLRDSTEYARMSCGRNPYGDGHASERIVRILLGASSAIRGGLPRDGASGVAAGTGSS
jgi:UDP-N-acetylglucosamine 2-epimerase (non-hydrolysing)